MDYKKIDKVGKIIVDTMLLGLLWAIIALPISSFSLVQLDTSSDVLSEQDVRTIEIQNYIEEEETKVIRDVYYEAETEDALNTVQR
jgi:hypothetical protein